MPANTSSLKSSRSIESAFSTFRKSSQSVTKQPQALTKVQNTLFNANMGLVHHVSHRFEWTGEDYEDLAQIGSIGLMVAVKKFEPSQGYAFSSYAIRCITGEIMHHLRDHGSLIKVPRAWREQLAKGKKLEAKGLNPAEELGITEDEWMMIREAHANQYHSSLEEVVVGEEDESEEDKDAPLPVSPEIAWSRMQRVLRELPAQDKEIMTSLAKGRTRQEVAAKQGISTTQLTWKLRRIEQGLKKAKVV